METTCRRKMGLVDGYTHKDVHLWIVATEGSCVNALWSVCGPLGWSGDLKCVKRIGSSISQRRIAQQSASVTRMDVAG